jgi:hypothetical protein
MALYAAVLLAFLLGFVTRRPSAMLKAPGIVVLYYLGLRYGWWGSGVGDGWQFAMSDAATAALIGAAAGYLCGLLASRSRVAHPDQPRLR